MFLQALLRGQPTDIVFYPRKGGLKSHFIAAGTPVHPVRPVQNIPLLRRALASVVGHGISMQSSDYDVLKAATELFERQFKSDIRKIAARMGIKNPDKNIQFRNKPKDLGRMREKARDEYEDNASVHTDTNACFLFAGSVDKVRQLTAFFRPSHNSKVVELKEKSAVPDETGFCGNTVKYVTTLDIGDYKNVPFVGEIIILRQGCKADYEASHKEVNRLRDVDSFLWKSDSALRKGLKDNAVIMAVGKAALKFGRSQFSLNEHMAAATGMAELKTERAFYLTEKSVPVMVVRDKRGEGYEQFITADTATGFYKIDNALATSLEHAQIISENDFVTICRGMIAQPDYARNGASGPLLRIAL